VVRLVKNQQPIAERCVNQNFQGARLHKVLFNQSG
jgi:hypothetical protein